MSYEPRDASVRVIGISVGFLAFLIVGSLITAVVVYRAKGTENRWSAMSPSRLIEGRTDVPKPDGDIGLHQKWLRQTSFTGGFTERLGIVEDRDRVKTESEQRLQAYGWIDQAHGIARIPIERAMALVAERGLPPEPANASPETISGGSRAAKPKEVRP